MTIAYLKTLRLLWMTAKAPFYRLRHHLGRELVVMISCGIFIGTFFYVFEDFLNVQIASLSLPLRERVAWVLLALLTATLAGSLGWRLAHDRRDFRGIVSLGEFLGEKPPIIRAYRRLWTGILLLLLVGGLGLASHLWLVPMSPLRLGGLFILTSLCTGGASLLGSRSAHGANLRLQHVDPAESPGLAHWIIKQSKQPKTTEAQHQVPTETATNRIIGIMVAYRIKQLLNPRSLRSWGIRLFQGTIALTGVLSFGLSGSIFLAGIGSLLAGLVLAALFSSFVAEDLSQSWTEKGLGVTHSLYITTLEHLVIRLLWQPALGAFVLVSLAQGFFGAGGENPSDTARTLTILVTSLQVSILGILPLLVIPWIALQIDGQKPAIPLMTSTIVGLFIGSAILAHPLALLLIPLLRAVALPYQAGRFYRAGS